MKYYKLKDNVALCGGPRGTTIEDKLPHPATDFADAEDLEKRGYIEETEPSEDQLGEGDKDPKEITDEDLLKLVEEEKLEDIKALVGEITDEDLLKLVTDKNLKKIKALIKAEAKKKQ